MKFFKASFLMAIFAVFIYSCGEDSLLDSAENLSKNEIQLVYVEGSGINRNNAAMLSFPDMESFQTTVTDLESQVEQLDDDFINTYADLSEEELNELEEQIGFNEDQPLIDFENELNFYSLRKKIEEEAYIYNGIEEPGDLPDPDDDVIFDDNIRTVLSINHEVIIGDIIYKINQDGSYWEIQNTDFSALQKVNAEPNNAKMLLSIPTVTMRNKRMSEDCGRNKEKGKVQSGKYRMKWMMKLYSLPWGGGLKVRVKGYKKKKKRWKKRRSYCKVGWKGLFCDGNGNLTLGNTNWIYSDRYNKKKWKWKTSGTTKSKDKQITGFFHAVGLSHTEVLDIP